MAIDQTSATGTVTDESPTTDQHELAWRIARSALFDPRGCEWEKDMRHAGVEPASPVVFRIGVPALALVMLAASALVALLSPEPGPSPSPLGLALIVAASIPWLRWSPGDDDGPTRSCAAFALAPVAALGTGQWSGARFGLGSDPAYLLATALILLVALMYVAFAEARLAVGVAIAAYASYGAPLAAGLALGKLTLDGTATVMWHLSFAFCVAAGYGIRLSYIWSKELGQAREALAWQAVAEERQRIARDVHDVVAHTLAITMLHITAARMAVRRSSPSEAEEALEEAERQGRASLTDIRRIIRLLRSDEGSTLDAPQPGLNDIEALVGGYRAVGLDIDYSFDVNGRRPVASAELALFRVLQEALTNAARHGSGPVTVSLLDDDGGLALTVTNPVQSVPPRPSRGSGLLGMRERIAAAGGTLDAGVRDGCWHVRAVIPHGAGA